MNSSSPRLKNMPLDVRMSDVNDLPVSVSCDVAGHVLGATNAASWEKRGCLKAGLRFGWMVLGSLPTRNATQYCMPFDVLAA